MLTRAANECEDARMRVYVPFFDRVAGGRRSTAAVISPNRGRLTGPGPESDGATHL